ncbi:WD40 repeat-like protein [Violaceomyces palustris]|uniref:WD40 repeat-like protein n=1 Tax=Violaceomyces palustris TaxID=1673888 RepID=A0ACD0NSH3_9BASI|nr:WD40 repeat-like protein [Violaceomyces palustris]
MSSSSSKPASQPPPPSTSTGSLFPSEVLLYSTSSSPTQVGSIGVTSLSSPSSTSPLLSFKGASDPAPHSIDLIPSSTSPANAGLGGLVLQLERSKAILNVYSWQRDHPILRIVLPQRLSSLSLSPGGQYCCAASQDGRIFLWELSTGILLSSFDAHYRPITVIRWSSDASCLVTASQDARILVWSLAGLLHPSQQSSSSITSSSNNPTPYCTLSDHNLPVTDLCLGSGDFPNSLTIWSSSLDGSVKMWDVRTRSLVSTFLFPRPIQCLSLDPTERFFFASSSPPSSSSSSTSSHRIYRVDLFRKTDIPVPPPTSTLTSGGYQHPRSQSRTMTTTTTTAVWQARGGGEQGQVERFSEEDEDEEGGGGGRRKRAEEDEDEDESRERRRLGGWIKMDQAITSLCLSQSSTQLCVGTSGGLLHLIDVSTSQILKTVNLTGNSKSNGGPSTNAVTNLRTLSRPRDLLVLSEMVGSNPSSNTNLLPIRPISNFGREIQTESSGLEHHRFPTRIQAEEGEEDQDPLLDFIDPILSNLSARNQPLPSPLPPSSFIQTSPPPSKGHEEIKTKRSLEEEVENLRSQLNRAKKVNDEIWKTLVRKTTNQSVSSSTS